MVPASQPDLAMREGKWKLLCDYDGSQPQLYDLANDRAETTDLADKEPEQVKRMSAAAVTWHRTMPQDNGPQLMAEPRAKGKKKGKNAK